MWRWGGTWWWWHCGLDRIKTERSPSTSPGTLPSRSVRSICNTPNACCRMCKLCCAFRSTKAQTLCCSITSWRVTRESPIVLTASRVQVPESIWLTRWRTFQRSYPNMTNDIRVYFTRLSKCERELDPQRGSRRSVRSLHEQRRVARLQPHPGLLHLEELRPRHLLSGFSAELLLNWCASFSHKSNVLTQTASRGDSVEEKLKT